MKSRSAWAAIAALVPVIAVTGAAKADHMNGFSTTTSSSGTVVVQPAPAPAPALPPVVVQPGQRIIVQQPGQSVPLATVPQPVPQMVQAEDLEANEVRAQTIYANKIEAPEVQGSIHPTGKIQLDRSVSDMKAATVVASVIYADTIKAHRVIADHIFVRDLERR